MKLPKMEKNIIFESVKNIHRQRILTSFEMKNENQTMAKYKQD